MDGDKIEQAKSKQPLTLNLTKLILPSKEEPAAQLKLSKAKKRPRSKGKQSKKRTSSKSSEKKKQSPQKPLSTDLNEILTKPN